MVDAKSKGGKAGASKDSKAKAVTQSSRAGLQVSTAVFVMIRSTATIFLRWSHSMKRFRDSCYDDFPWKRGGPLNR